MTIEKWALGYVKNIIKAYHPRMDVKPERVLKCYKERYRTDLSKVVMETHTDTLTEIASQFGNITAEMINEGHRKKYGKSHPGLKHVHV